MPDRSTEVLERYLPWRRWFEAGFWTIHFSLTAFLNSVIVQLDVDRVSLQFESWEPVVWEWSSNMVVLALVPAVIAFERRFPLQFGALRRNLPWHVLGAVGFSVLHVVLMVAVREQAYRLMGGNYDFGEWPRELFYEFLKDSRGYAGILLVVYLYRLLLLRLQGEARLLDAAPGEPPADAGPEERPDRFLVKMLGKEFLVAARDIELLQASGNYVNLRVRGREYPLRTTMAAIASRLDPRRFVRVHRSYIVNIDCIAQIEPLETGDARVQLLDGTVVPCSRRYRPALR